MKGIGILAAVSVACALAGSVSAQAPAEAKPLGAVALRDNAMDDAYLVTSRTHYGKHGAAFGELVSARTAKDGTRVVISRLKEHQLPDLGQRMHEQERVCAGYFAFATRAEAEAFVAKASTPRPPGGVPVSYTIDNRAVVNALLSQPSETNIRNTIGALSGYPNRYFNSAYGADASATIRDWWRGLAGSRSEVTVEQTPVCANCGVQPSVILTIRGSKFPNEIVVLGGHLDSISNSGTGNNMNAPGADDDASGIATLTEILRVAMANDYRPARTVKFMAYAAEEVGLRGSRAIAQSFRAEGRNVVGALQLDMTNYRTGTVDMRIVTDFSSEPLKLFYAALFDEYLAPLGYTRATDTCGYACSDHASWTQYGFPSGMMFEAGDGGASLFPYIHTVNDRLAVLGNTAEPSVPLAQFGLAFLGELGKGTLLGGSISGNGPRPPLQPPPRQK